MTKVSIVMSVRNQESYVLNSVKSILNQSFKDFEFIIIDDHSSDSTLDILKKIKDKRIRLFRNRRKIGLTKSLNRGLLECKGEYIARMDGDDISERDRFKIQISFLDTHPNVGVVGSWVKTIDEKGTVIGYKQFPQFDSQIRDKLFYYNPIRHSTVVFRKSLIDNYGLYDENLDGAEDYDLWLRFAKYTRLHNLSYHLLKYRIHKESVSTLQEKKVLKSAIRARIKSLKSYGYRYFLLFPVFVSVVSYYLPSNIKKVVRISIFNLFKYTILIFQKTAMLTSVGMRLVKYTGKYKEIMHPKHLTKEGKEWFLAYIKKNYTVLDIGCNNGQNTAKAATKCKKVIGFDFDENLLKIAQRDIKRKKINNIKLIRSNAEHKLPFRDNTFDVVLFFAVLEHLVNRKQAVQEVSRVLKPAGTLLLSVPNKDTTWKRMQRHARLSYYSDADHKIEFTKNSIKSLLEANSFKVIKLNTVALDMPFVGVIDMLGGISLTLYKVLSQIRRSFVLKYPNQTVSFEIIAQNTK